MTETGSRRRAGRTLQLPDSARGPASGQPLPCLPTAIVVRFPKLANDLTFYGPASLDMWFRHRRYRMRDIQATITEVASPDGSENPHPAWLAEAFDRAQDPLRSSELLPYQK